MRIQLAALILVSHLVACGSGGSGDDSDLGANNGANSSGGTGKAPTDCTPRKVPWLIENNFWRTTWDAIVGRSNPSAKVGEYRMTLGKPAVTNGYTLYPLIVEGETGPLPPLWKSIGTDTCGDIVVSDGNRIVTVYDATTDAWSGTGLWHNFDKSAKVDSDATIIPSRVTVKLDVFDPPLTSIGTSTDTQGYDRGGCEYYGPYGTVCTEGRATGQTTDVFEYWSDKAGPVAFHESAWAPKDDGHENRVEVWFFGDNSDPQLQWQHEPDSYAKPEPLKLTSDLNVVLGDIGPRDPASGAIAGFSPPAQATGVQDWFSLEVPASLDGKDITLFLGADGEGEVEFLLFTAPDSGYGFKYVMTGYQGTAAEAKDLGFDHVCDLSGTYTAAKYLVGVHRKDAGTNDFTYSVMTLNY